MLAMGQKGRYRGGEETGGDAPVDGAKRHVGGDLTRCRAPLPDSS